MKKIQVEELFKLQSEMPLLDVRTPAEYQAGHIPGALNLPLFTDEERVVVGTLYKQVSPEKAFEKGLEFAGARLAWYVKEAKRLAPGGKIILHCWRGGQRSGSLAWLLRFAGFEVFVLTGGYKAYRTFIHEVLAGDTFRYLVLGGPTGSGKTAILHALRAEGEQVVDLEGIACHKGSAFGALGELPQPSVEQFENALYQQISGMDIHRRIWVENESRSIGRVYLPDPFWRRLQHSALIKMDVPFGHRVDYLVGIYGQYDKADLVSSFQRIERKLGGQFLKIALAALEEDDLATAAAIALKYYDKSYSFTTSKGHFNPIITCHATSTDVMEVARQLITLADANGV